MSGTFQVMVTESVGEGPDIMFTFKLGSRGKAVLSMSPLTREAKLSKTCPSFSLYLLTRTVAWPHTGD